MSRTHVFLMLLALLAANDAAHAGMLSSLLRSGGRSAARQGAKQAGKSAAAQAARHSVKSAAQTRTLQTFRHFGDDAVRAGGKIATHSTAFADDLAKVSGAITPQNHRRLMMLAPELKKSGQATAVVSQLAKSNKADDAIEFLWRHRGKLASATALTALAVHADDIAKVGGEFVAKPLIEGSIEHVAKPVTARVTNVVTICVVTLVLLLTIRFTIVWRHLVPYVRLAKSWRPLVALKRGTVTHSTTTDSPKAEGVSND